MYRKIYSHANSIRVLMMMMMMICTSSSSAAAVAYLSLPLSLSLSLFRGTSHNIAISVPTLLFFRSYNEVFVQTAFIAYFPSGKYYFAM